MARLCGATLGLFAFSVTIFLGLLADNPIEETMWRSLSAMGIFCGIGIAVGWVAGRVLDEYALNRNHELFGDEKPEPPHEAAAEQGDVITLAPVGS